MILPALSIRQPWAWLISHGHKDIENRNWGTNHRFRGRVLIHAGKGMSERDWHDAADLAWIVDKIPLPTPACLDRGGIVGECIIGNCVTESNSPWFKGPYGFVLSNQKALPFFACKGSLGFFKVDYPF